MSDPRDVTKKIQHEDPVLVACMVFQAQAPGHLIQKIGEAITAIAAQTSVCPVISEATLLRPVPDDGWLKHAEAAEYLGISKSTLYQYASQQRIECRKLAGRLEYRRSTLDQFKAQRIRPAHEWFSQRSIIPTALGSGK